MLTSTEIKKIPKSFDIVGDILIFSEFPKELKKKEKEVGNYLLKKIKNIKVVAKKSKFYSGKYRTPKLKILAGEKRKETIHKESGVLIKINPEKAYFSPRSSNERLRVSKLVKKGEEVLVMFSGVMPFGLVIGKNTNAKKVYGIEINKHAHKYAKKNIKINKLHNVHALKGNVKKVLPKINKKFDRIIMPLPKNSEDYIHTYLHVCS